jgi:hypothetical protein
MDYVITNSSRKIFVKLDEHGKAVTCVKSAAQKFSDKKAKNVLSSLPKTLKKFHFMIVPMPGETKSDVETNLKEVTSKCEVKVVAEKKTIKNYDYEVPEKVVNWIGRVESFNNLIVDATTRKNELFEQLSNVDKELSNCLHEIELTRSKNACDGYKEYRKVKTVLEKRRVIKDELAVVQSISDCDINFNNIENLVDRLKNREFAIRDIEDYAL